MHRALKTPTPFKIIQKQSPNPTLNSSSFTALQNKLLTITHTPPEMHLIHPPRKIQTLGKTPTVQHEYWKPDSSGLQTHTHTRAGRDRSFGWGLVRASPTTTIAKRDSPEMPGARANFALAERLSDWWSPATAGLSLSLAPVLAFFPDGFSSLGV